MGEDELPAFFTHRAAGERVLRKLDLGAVIHCNAFYLGCQGPDILYSNKSSVRSGLHLGLIMHNKKTRELLCHALDFLKKYDEKDKDELGSYLAGFVVHYIVDKNTHPYIYRKSGRNVGIHHAVEYMWDSYTSKEEWGLEVKCFDVFSDVMYGELGEGISDWYVSVAKDVYKRRVNGDITKRAQLNFAKSKQKMFTNSGFTKKVFFRMTSGIKTDEMLRSHSNEHSLFSREDFYNVQKMITHSVNEARDFIRFMFRYIEGTETHLPDYFVDRNFSGIPLAALE